MKLALVGLGHKFYLSYDNRGYPNEVWTILLRINIQQPSFLPSNEEVYS